MSRFEIEDIFSQDKKGILYRASDSEKGHAVALRRFFPFGQNGGGLMEEEAIAFREAAQRLVKVNHPSLRAIFSGEVDPIDHMPYIIAEWVDGVTLADVLNGEPLDPKHVIQILQLALEASLLLSEVLEEEAVWVETDIRSICVGSEESEREFVFWLSPFKWLGAEFESRKLAALVDLGEQLAGWKGKIVRDQAGCGLGGWLKWMKNNPEASLSEAIESLPTFLSDTYLPSTLTKPSFIAPVVSHSTVSLNHSPFFSPFMVAACACLLSAVGALAYFQLKNKDFELPSLYAEQALPGPTRAEAPNPPSALPTPAPKTTAISAVQEMANQLAQEKETQRAAALLPSVAIVPPVHDFTPKDSEKISPLKASSLVSVTGVVRNIRHSSTGRSMYFEFSAPLNPKEINAVAHQKSYEGEFQTEAYSGLIGKKLRFDGVVMREPSGRQYVKISSSDKITEAK